MSTIPDFQPAYKERLLCPEAKECKLRGIGCSLAVHPDCSLAHLTRRDCGNCRATTLHILGRCAACHQRTCGSGHSWPDLHGNQELCRACDSRGGRRRVDIVVEDVMRALD